MGLFEEYIAHRHALHRESIALVHASKKGKTMPSQITIPEALATISAGRDHIQTFEFSRAFSRAAQTIRKSYCLTGHYLGIRPLKLGNRLMWPVADIAALLNGSV